MERWGRSDTTTEWGFSWSAVTMWNHKGSDNNDILLCSSFKTGYWYQAHTLMSQLAQSHNGGIKCRYSANKNVAVDSPEQQTSTGRQVVKRASQTGPCPSQSDAEMTYKTHSWCLNWKITRKTQPWYIEDESQQQGRDDRRVALTRSGGGWAPDENIMGDSAPSHR